MAYQCHREDLAEGIILAFRRSQCASDTIRVSLWGLSPHARYEVDCEDIGTRQILTGKALAQGLEISTEDRLGSLLISYRQR